jgi:hypothetical protein
VNSDVEGFSAACLRNSSRVRREVAARVVRQLNSVIAFPTNSARPKDSHANKEILSESEVILKLLMGRMAELELSEKSAAALRAAARMED